MLVKKGKMRRAVTTIILCILLACLLYGCSFSRRAALVELIPAKSFVVLVINWQTVSKDESLKKIVKGDQLERILRQLNLANSAVNDIAIFSVSPEANGSNGMILRGLFNQRNVLDDLKTRGWQEQIVQGHQACFHNNDYIAPLKSNLLVFGTRDGVEGVIKAEANRSANFASTTNYKKLAATLSDKQKPISMMLVMPQETQDIADAAMKISSGVLDLAGVGSLGTLLEKVGTLHGAGCNIARYGNSFPVELVVMLKDENTAGLISGSLNLMKQLAVAPRGNVSTSDVATYRSFQSMSVTRNHEVLFIKLTMAEQELLQNMSGR